MSEFLSGKVRLLKGDCLDLLKTLADNSVDSVVTDPPYHLTSIVKRFGGKNAAPAQHGTDGAFKRSSAGFMGKQWDGGDIAFRVELWAEVMRVLKPGGHLVAFSGTRTYHRMTCAIEDAGFEIRDQIGWVFGSGFPKSHDVSKAIDKSEGIWRGRAKSAKSANVAMSGMNYERTEKGEPVHSDAIAWQGWGTAIKPAWEPICLARKPLSEKTVAANVLRWGTGAINIDATRVRFLSEVDKAAAAAASQRACLDQNANRTAYGRFENGAASIDPYLRGLDKGRFPANIVHDGSEEVLAAFPETGASTVGDRVGGCEFFMGGDKRGSAISGFGDSGSAARFFYTAKADADDRLGSKHPTVKPVDLIQWLVRLVTPKGGLVLDPFSGTGTTGEAAFREGCMAVLIEREPEYQADIARRMALCLSGPDERSRESIKARMGDKQQDHGPLFAEPASQPASQPAKYANGRSKSKFFVALDPIAPSDQ